MTSLFDILLLSVIVATAYMGPMVLRRLPPGRRAYGFMILADLGVAILAFASRGEGDGQVSQMLGVVAIGGAVCLLMVPPLLRDLTRRALSAERFRMARWLVDLRELLQPGMGGRQESELISTILAVRSGQVDAALERMRERRKEAPDALRRRQVDERIVMTLLYARRWEEAIESYELGFSGDFSTTSPQLMVEMVRAYCETSDLDSAAALMARLETAPLLAEPVFAALVHRARLVFLAFVGRTGAVESIVQGPLAAMPESARHYWAGIARLNAGDKSGARSELSQAAELSPRESRARELAERVLGRVDDPGVAGPRAMSAEVASLADRLTAATTAIKKAPETAPARQRGAPVTMALVAINLVVAGAMALLFRSTADIGALVEAGANLKPAVRSGEYWRLASSMFLHVGLWHLVLNMYGLWVLGRLVEPMYGGLRFFAVYMAAGLIGAGASVIFGGDATSAGASGAVFGILGAAIAELALRRDSYPESWRKRLLGNLLFLTAANVGIGFAVPMIDQAAHIGGLVGGALFAALLAPRRAAEHGLMRRFGAWLVAGLGAVSIAYAAVGVATTSFEETLGAYPQVTRHLGGLEVRVPYTWKREPDTTGLTDTSLPLLFFAARLPGDATPEQVVEARVEAELQGGAKALGFDRVAVADALALRLPDGWVSSELIATVEGEGLGGSQRYRAVVFARESGDELWFGVSYLPASLATPIGRVLGTVLSSARARGALPETPTATPEESSSAP